MNEDQLKAAFAAALAAGWPERTGYVLALLAHCLAGGARLRSGAASADKLAALNELQYAVTGRLVDLFMYCDRWPEAAFVEELYTIARRGGCEQELATQLREVLTVLALRGRQARDDQNRDG